MMEENMNPMEHMHPDDLEAFKKKHGTTTFVDAVTGQSIDVVSLLESTLYAELEIIGAIWDPASIRKHTVVGRKINEILEMLCLKKKLK